MQSVLLSLSPLLILRAFSLCSGTHFSPSQTSHWLRPHSTFSLFFWDSCHSSSHLAVNSTKDASRGVRYHTDVTRAHEVTLPTRPHHIARFTNIMTPRQKRQVLLVPLPSPQLLSLHGPASELITPWQSKNFPLGSIKLPTYSHFPSPRLLKIPSTNSSITMSYCIAQGA